MKQIYQRDTVLISAISRVELGALSYGRITLSVGLKSVFINTCVHCSQLYNTTENYLTYSRICLGQFCYWDLSHQYYHVLNSGLKTLQEWL